MATSTPAAPFTPVLSKTESKAEAVSRIAKTMIDEEIAKRDAKTARLRQARLDQEAADRAAAPKAKSGARRVKVAGK